MATLIIYSSKHGTTAKVANLIAQGLGCEPTSVINLQKESANDLSKYDTIIIGGSIHAGAIQKKISKFIARNTISLLEKKLALFMCCMDKDATNKQFENAYPQLLRNHATAVMCPGGEFLFEKMNFIERLVVKKISGINSTTSNLNATTINQFVSKLK